MGSKTSKKTTTQTTSLPENQQGNVDLLMQGAQDLYKTGGPTYNPAATYAGATPAQLAGQTAATNYATGAGQGFVDTLQQGEKFWLNPQNVFNPSNIPGFQNAQNGVTQDVTRNLMENILPQIHGAGIGGGTLGSSKQGISEGLAVGRTNDALSQTLAKMNMDAYSQGLGMYNSAAGRAGQTFDLGLRPADTLNTVGTAQRADQQGALDDATNRWNFNQIRPIQNLQNLKDLTGSSGEYGGSTKTEEVKKSSGGGLMKAIGVGMQLLSIMYPGVGTAIGALAGTALKGGGGGGGAGGGAIAGGFA